MTEATLFDSGGGKGRMTFLRYHQLHPEIFEWMVRFSLEALHAGFKRFSMKYVASRVRWYVHIERREGDKFKINDKWLGLYARLIERTVPELEGFFRKRRLRGKHVQEDAQIMGLSIWSPGNEPTSSGSIWSTLSSRADHGIRCLSIGESGDPQKENSGGM